MTASGRKRQGEIQPQDRHRGDQQRPALEYLAAPAVADEGHRPGSACRAQ